jgi:hypothetical protein
MCCAEVALLVYINKGHGANRLSAGAGRAPKSIKSIIEDVPAS